MTRFTTATLLLSLAAMPAAAQSFVAENRVTVNGLGAGAFEVIEGGEHGARSIWCAASDYAQDVLGATGTQRLYVTGARGDAQTVPGRKGVIFSTQASGQGGGGVLSLGASIRTPGSNLTVDHSYQFCYDRRLTTSR
ncbi:MAG: hypothetical protein AAGF60_16850 [Pseudomonadota bacterium]